MVYKASLYTLFATNHKKEPLIEKGSQEEEFFTLCIFLYIVDLTRFLFETGVREVYKKRTFCIWFYFLKIQ